MIAITHIAKQEIYGEIDLPLSKSICNRILIIEALIGNIQKLEIEFKSNDNRLLLNALTSDFKSFNFEDAGTPMRLFLAYACLRNKCVTIMGNLRLQERPIEPLVKALSELGAVIKYTQNEGYLPIQIEKGVNLDIENVAIDGSMSSQFVSALLLIAPYFTEGLTIELIGTKQSESYIDTTIGVMKNYNVLVSKINNKIFVSPQKYSLPHKSLLIKDWSAATFMYNIVAVAPKANMFLPNLFLAQLQADEYTALLYKNFGVETIQQSDGILIQKNYQCVKKITVDFTLIPDMFPAVVACCVVLHINANFTGVKNLILKESNRIEAMQENIAQIGAKLIIQNNDFLILNYPNQVSKTFHFKPYNDHRIAMACSIFAFQKDIKIDNEEVVAKSFADYWEIFRMLTQ